MFAAELFNVAGRRVAEREVRGAGAHEVSLATGQRLPPGIYLVRLVQGNAKSLRRVTVLE